MILDQYTDRVPTGTSYEILTNYTEYSDAGSVDNSPFRIDKLTNNTGGILFYSSTELNAEENANTFRLTSTTGNFDLNSFNLEYLNKNPSYGDGVPSLKLTSSTGEEITYAAFIPDPLRTSYVILDQYTDQVPTGTSYSILTNYTEYSDAGSVDNSRFRIKKLTNNTGGILFYNDSTELIAEDNANTFRLKSTTGNFDLNSFNLELESNLGDGDGVPSLKLTSSTGEEITYASEFSESEKNLSWANVEWVDFTSAFAKAKVNSFNLTSINRIEEEFSDTGTKNLSWSNVEWVDFTSQSAKAKVNSFNLTAIAVPEPSTYAAIFGAIVLFGTIGFRRRAKQTADQ